MPNLHRPSCLLAVGCLTALSAPALRAEEKDPREAGGLLERAAEFLEKKQFAKAEVVLSEFLESRPKHAVANLSLGVAILGQEEALGRSASRARLWAVETYCSKALDLDSGLTDAWKVRALARARLDEWLLSRFDLAQLSESPAADGRETDSDRRPEQLGITLRLGAAYDTNVPLIGRNTGLPREFGRPRDVRATRGLDFEYRIFPTDRFEFGFGLGASASWHADLDPFDEQVYGLSTYVRHRAAPWLDLGLRYQYAYSLLGRQQYSSGHRLTPFASLLRSTWWRTTVYYEFEHRRFSEVPSVESSPPFDRSGDLHAVGVTQRLVLSRSDIGQLTFDAGYRHENVNTKGVEYDALSETLNAGLAIPLRKDVTLRLGGVWAWEDYKRRSILDARRRGRKDFVQEYSIAMDYDVHEDVSVEGYVIWTEDDSNVRTTGREAVYSYDRVMYGFQVAIRLRPM